jgi:fructan beta-fructosidase
MVMRSFFLVLAVLVVSRGQALAAVIAEDGVARTVIVVDPAATATEFYAARQLASFLQQITGASFEVRTNIESPARAIMVGRGSAATACFPEIPFAQLGEEEMVIRTKGERILLAGGRPRGTLYAVSRFLQDACGVRWWTPWASRIPHQPTLRTADVNARAKPAFEYRDPYWRCAFDADWSWRNFCNGQAPHLTAEQGGCVIYKNFVHSFYTLVPPEKYFAAHPEWFSLVNGHRTADNAQLCLSNPDLRDFVVERVKQALRESPEARIISVSQNDCFNPCQCAQCKALDDAEGSHAGSMIAFVNYIAEKIEPEFPTVAVDTLAYQYTRKPPRALRPRPNVIVRLCSIECDFRQTLDGPANAAFADDIRGWEEKTDRLYIWDYVTDFSHYLQPFPDWFALAPNLRFFQAHHVRGVFEEGAYESFGAEMAELRAWVLAQLLWNPQQDDHALIREFLEGYYGAAGQPLARYLDLMQKASQGYKLTISAPTDAPFLSFQPLAQAESCWQEAEQAVKDNDELLARVRQGRLAVQCVWLSRWDALRKECSQAGARWPFTETRGEFAQRWLATAYGVPRKPWTKVTAVREGGLAPQEFVSQILKAKRKFKIEQRYLNLPIKNGAPKRKVTTLVDGHIEEENEIELADSNPDWWAFIDVSKWRGQTVTLAVDDLPEGSTALSSAEQSDSLKGAWEIYREPLRGQFHFSSRRGWNNDPNGLGFFNDEYHLFYQHNPYGWDWGNMHWGHAVSRDLVHWRELGDALAPDELGPMFSGSAVVDWKNTSGLGLPDQPAQVLIYTAAGNPTVQCIASSTDGRNYNKFKSNPVVRQITGGNRDPKVFWHEPSSKWVMVLYVETNKVHTIHFLSSPNLKDWTVMSRTEGFFECPDFFELPVNGDASRKKWVLTAASSEYMIGSFDGTTFTAETAKLPGHRGSGFYAAQTFSDIPPSDGRRIQIGWLQTATPGMPFNQSMSIPMELALAGTPEGPRLTWNPVKELRTLRTRTWSFGPTTLNPDSVNPLAEVKAELMELRAEFDPGDAKEVAFDVRGAAIVYDAKKQEISVNNHRAPAPPRDGKQQWVIYCDRTALEVFASGGLTYVPMPFTPKAGDYSLGVHTAGGSAKITSLEVHELKSAWQ